MEAFSLLKYWRGAGGINSGGSGGGGGGDSLRAAGTTTIVTAVAQSAGETDDDDDDDGPFFDLEFAVPDEDDVEDGDENESGEQDGANRENQSEEDDDEFDGGGDVDGEGEFNFTLSSGSSIDRTDQNLSLSPSDDLFFKGRLVPIEPSSLVFNPSEPNSKPPQFPVSLLKSATKFRVSMLGLKKPKPCGNDNRKAETNEPLSAAPKPQQKKQNKEQTQQQQQQRKSLTVKFKVEEVPIVSLFTRDSSRSASAGNKSQKQNVEESVPDEKRFSKEAMQKYLRKVKPLYFRVSRRYGEKLRFSGQLSLGAGAKAAPPSSKAEQKPAPVKSAAEKAVAEPEASDQVLVNNIKMSQKLGNLPTGLRVVCKHLGKSRSASSSAVAAAPTAPVSSRRRDDSLLQQQDGIQGAILHCKRSFNASRDSESNSLLSRSVSDPSSDKSSELAMKSSVEGNDGHSDQSP